MQQVIYINKIIYIYMHSNTYNNLTSRKKEEILLFLNKKQPPTHNIIDILKPYIYIRPSNTIIKKTISSTNNPLAFAKYYNFPTQQNQNVKPKIGIISFGGSYFTNDLNYYWRVLLNLSTIPTVNYVQVNGATNIPDQHVMNDSGSSIENTLDIEIIGAICPNSIITIYFTPNNLNNIKDVLDIALNNNDVVSISWGAAEIIYGQNLINDINTVFAKYQTKIICVASGDNGCSDEIKKVPNIDYPSSCPYVTSVGGTTVNLTTKSEVAWLWNKSYKWGSGGSPSLYISEPTFQNKTQDYIYPTVKKQPNPYISLQTLINNGRKVPDVALNADPITGWDIYFNGSIQRIGGTSASASCLAAYFGLCNLQFNTNINNILYDIYYKDRTIFKDIKVESNNINIPYFFDARTDYDLCTGLGSFNGIKLLEILKTYSI